MATKQEYIERVKAARARMGMTQPDPVVRKELVCERAIDPHEKKTIRICRPAKKNVCLFPVRPRVDFEAEWVARARMLRQGKRFSWCAIARIVGKSIHQVRYAIDENYRAANIRNALRRYQKHKQNRATSLPSRQQDAGESGIGA